MFTAEPLLGLSLTPESGRKNHRTEVTVDTEEKMGNWLKRGNSSALSGDRARSLASALY
jgi:hypothetical protein